MSSNPHKTYFISDCHLSEKCEGTLALFMRFMQDIQKDATALYILGDLFDVWIGDDLNTPLINKVKQAIKHLNDNHVPVFIIPGNRDFLIGKRFCQETGCKLLKEPTIISLNGQPTLIMHGDTLTTKDITYQRYRRLVRMPFVQSLFLRLPRLLRSKIAGRLRNQSMQHQKKITLTITDVAQGAVEEQLTRYHTRILIHGHTHRPQHHTFKINELEYERYVLGDWHPSEAKILCADGNGLQLVNFRQPN